MDITVSVRFRLYQASAFIDSKFGSVVDQSWHIFLLHDVNLARSHAKVIVLLKESHSAIVSVIRHHDPKRYHKVRTESRVNFPCSFLTCQSILGIELQVRVVLCDSAYRETYFDARKPEALPKTPGNQHKAKLGQFLQTELLHLIEFRLLWLEENAGWDVRPESIKRIYIVARGFKKAACSVAVVLQATRCHSV